ncbi:MAG: hypothetical protein ACU0DI_06015 [Paracoccaceae bacterium]
MTISRQDYDAAKAVTASARAEMAELRGQGIGEIMSLAGDPALLKVTAEVIATRGLDTTPQAYLRSLLEKQRDAWIEKYKVATPEPTHDVPGAAVRAYREKINGSA